VGRSVLIDPARISCRLRLAVVEGESVHQVASAPRGSTPIAQHGCTLRSSPVVIVSCQRRRRQLSRLDLRKCLSLLACVSFVMHEVSIILDWQAWSLLHYHFDPVDNEVVPPSDFFRVASSVMLFCFSIF
jgi:hypothetical protein